MIRGKAEIAFTKDIIRAVSIELDIEEKKVRYVYNMMVKYLHHLIRYTDAIAIPIPRIGILYTNIHHAGYVLKNKNKFLTLNRIHSSMRAKLSRMREHIRNFTPITKNVRSLHQRVPRIKEPWRTNGFTMEQIEGKQNNK